MLALALALSLSLLLAAAPAWSAGLNLRWNECAGSAGALLAQTFACDANAGVEVLVPTITLDESFPALEAAEVILDVVFESSVTPSWWLMYAGECRAGALTGSRAMGPAWSGCYDPWPASAVALASATSSGSLPAGHARLLGVCAVPATDTFTVAPSTEGLYLLTLTIAHSKTTGAGLCEGCATRACVVLSRVGLYSGRDDQPVYYSPVSDGQSNPIALWQPAPGQDTCPFWVPTRNRTWGQVKSLYH